MSTKRADQMKAGDAFSWSHQEDIEGVGVITVFTVTLDRDVELRPDQFGIDRAVLYGTVSNPRVAHGSEALEGGELAPKVAEAMAQGPGYMVLGAHLELELV